MVDEGALVIDVFLYETKLNDRQQNLTGQAIGSHAHLSNMPLVRGESGRD